VRELVEVAFAEVDRTIVWKGEGVDEVGRDARSGEVLVAIDPKYYRPTEVEQLLGDPTKAREKLGWSPKIGFRELIKEMVQAELESVPMDARTGRLAAHH
jgi:GDPmannose 4,6-dehydratase